MSDYTKNYSGSGYNSTTNLDAEFTAIETSNNSKLDKTGGTLTGQLDMNSQKIINLADGVAAKDAVNMSQLQDVTVGIVEGTVRFYDTIGDATTDIGNIDVGDVILLKERTATENGESTWDAVDATTVTEDEYSIVTGNATVSLVLRTNGVSNVREFGAGPSISAATNTLAMQAAIDAGTDIYFPRGAYNIDDELVLGTSGVNIILETGVIITQTTADKAVFKADSLSKLKFSFNNALSIGEGTWSSGWTGNSGHDDRVIHLINCTDCVIDSPNIRDGANAGIALVGCERITIRNPFIEGTHAYTTALSGNDNFQNGIYIKHDSVEGLCKNIRIISPLITGCAQGILVEGYSAMTDPDDLNVVIQSPVIYGIPGQHGIYCQTGSIVISDMNIDDCYLDGVKIQDNGTVNPKDVTITGQVSNCLSHGVELQAENVGGSLTNVTIDVIARDCQRGLGINGRVEDVRAKIISINASQYGTILQGSNLKRIQVECQSNQSGRQGIYVTAPTCEDVVLLNPVVRKASSGNTGTYDGIDIENSGDIIIYNPDVDDEDGDQRYAFFGQAGTIRVRGSARLLDGTTYDARANVVLQEWPTDVTLSGVSEQKLLNFGNFTKSPHPVVTECQTTSTSGVTLFQMALEDNSSYIIKSLVVAKKSDSAERIAFETYVHCYRDGGGAATVESGLTDSIFSDASASNNAAWTWEMSGNNARLRVDSGAVETYDWKARTTVVSVID